MSAMTTSVSLKLTGVTARASAKVTRRAQKLALRASVDEKEVTFTADDLATDMKAADAAWTETAAEKEPVSPAAFSAAIDPADGSVAEAAPLGDDMSMLNDAMIAFKEPRAVEMINGRAAMIGWMVALYVEFTKNQSLFHQVINTRTFTLADGVVKSSTFPAPGMFLIPVTVMAVLAAPSGTTMTSTGRFVDSSPDARRRPGRSIPLAWYRFSWFMGMPRWATPSWW